MTQSRNTLFGGGLNAAQAHQDYINQLNNQNQLSGNLLNQVVQMGGNAGTSLGAGLGRLFGGLTPAEAEAKNNREMYQQAFVEGDEVQSMLNLAQMFDAQGDPERATQVRRDALNMANQREQLDMAQQQRTEGIAEREASARMGESMAGVVDPSTFTPEQMRAVELATAAPHQRRAIIEKHQQQIEAEKEEVRNQRVSEGAKRLLAREYPDLSEEEIEMLTNSPASARQVVNDALGSRQRSIEYQKRRAEDIKFERERAAVRGDTMLQTFTGPDGQVLTETGRIPVGFEMFTDENGNRRQRPIAGSPADIKAAQDAEKARLGSEVVLTAAQTVFEDSGRAIALIDDKGRRAAGFGSLFSFIPETSAKELDGHVESIKGNIGIDQLLKIKQSGAGLGAIPQAQLEMLASLLGNLDTKQSPAVLRQNILRIQEIYSDIVEKEGGDPIAMAKSRGFTEGFQGRGGPTRERAAAQQQQGQQGQQGQQPSSTPRKSLNNFGG